MKRYLPYYITSLLLLCSFNTVFSQQITVDGSVPLQQLIQDNLIQNGCVEISNITSSINGISSGFLSYGQFNRSGSNFPFQSGIILTTGNAESAGNTVTTPVLDEGASNWNGDADLETALGITNSINATSIEFDLISTSSQLQFNYLFASEEYFGTNPCYNSDGFAFLIRESTSPTYQNIAVVPGTSSPVNTGTIHTDIYNSTGGLLCSAQNEQYFDGLGIGDTNYNGRTLTLTAATTIIPYVQYRIKLVIADQGDFRSDSAVFIEGNSFKILDLGDDISSCFGSDTLDADIQNPLASYEWFLDNNSIGGQTNSTLPINQSGTYRVEVTVPLPSGGDCIETDEIIVVLNIEEPVDPISDYQLCDDVSNGAGTETFNLAIKNPDVVGVIPFINYSFTYHLSDAEARSNTNSIITPIQNTINPQPIFVRINDADTGCSTYASFNLVVNPAPNIVTPTTLEVCDNDDIPEGFYFIDLTEKDAEITGGLPDLAVTYYFDATDAANGNNSINSLYRNRTTPTDRVFARVINTLTTCVSSVVPLDINVTISPIINFETQYIDACDADHDGFAIFNLTEKLNDILNGISPASITATYHELLTDAEMGTSPIPNETNYPNIIAEEQTVYVRIEDNATGCASVAPLEIHTNFLLTGTDIQDFAICDDNADPNDALNFDLNTIEFFINNNIDLDSDPTTIDITVDFFEDETDRNNNVNALPKNVLYTAPNQTTLFIRLENTLSSCIDVEEIRLLINPILVFNPTDPLPYCDNDADVTDGITTIDLHFLDDLITGGNTDFTTSFFPSQADADGNNTANQLPDMYTNTNSQETIFVRIENIDTGCNTSNSFDIRVIASPVTTVPTDIIECGTSDTIVLNLEDKIPEIVSNTTGINIDFFTSLDDADNNTNVIPNRTAYATGTQTIFVRIGDNTSNSDCYKIESFEIIVNATPTFSATGINDFVICDGDINGEAEFLFINKDADVLDGQTGKEVYYYENPDYTGLIDKTTLYLSGDRTIYVRIENITDASCNATSSFEIRVASDIIFNPFTPFVECDDQSNDEKQTFDLDLKITEIAQGVPDPLNVSFHLTNNLAESNSGALPLSYTNATNPQTLYVRIEDRNSLCFTIEVLDINIVPAPDVTDANPLELCDDDNDGSTIFDLALADFEILDRIIGPPPVINYFENEADTIDDALEITNPNTYLSDSKTIYIKITNLTGCYTVIPLQLVVNPYPTINTVTTLVDCYSDSNIYDLSQVDSLIVNDPSAFNITYHNNPNDADDDLGAIGNTFNYIAPGNYTIWIRTENPTTGCYITSSFVLEVNPNPVANIPPDLEDCDDDYDGFRAFNLSNTSSTSNAIRGAQSVSNFPVTYYLDLTNAENATSPIATSYPAQDGDIIYARIENIATGCYSTTQFNVIVNEKPLIPLDDVITLCINDLPLVISAETGIVGDIYLWSTGETSPEIALNNPTDIGSYWVNVTTPATSCFTTKPFEVIESAIADINFTTTVDFADPNSITVDVSGIGDYVFSLDGGEPQTSNVFENAPIGEHTITVTDLNGCNDVTRDVVVIDVPKFVTPNGDGNFDTWHITGVNQLTGTVVYVYNRLGKLLKTLPHTSPGWDGTFNGQNMPSDDYWYVANVFYEGTEFQIKGHFALKR